jgi:hypothetical protein
VPRHVGRDGGGEEPLAAGHDLVELVRVRVRVGVGVGVRVRVSS